MNRLPLPRSVPLFLIVASSLFFGAEPCVAQSADEGWQVTFTPYAWLAGQTGQLEVGGVITDVDLSFGDILENLDMSLMGILEARHGKWTGRLDLIYVSLLIEQDLVQPAPGEVDLQQDQVVAQPELGYAVLQRPWGRIDVLAGLRYWHLTADLGLSVSGGPSTTREGSQDWADATLGGRVLYRAGDKWRLYGKVDIGAGGSQFTWQAAAGADLGRCCALTAAYRHLDVDYDDEVVFDTYLTGPALGVELRF
jgi:hypothetical protein